MITCPSCNHQNPEGSLQCENCYTPLPASISCPNCGASVQTDATFCGQCGFNLQAENPLTSTPIAETEVGSIPDISLEEVSLPKEVSQAEATPEILPEISMSSPIQSPWDEDEDEDEDMTIGQTKPMANNLPEIDSTEMIHANPSIPNIDSVPDLEFSRETESPSQTQETTNPWESDAPDLDLELEPTQVSLEVQSEPEKSEMTSKSTTATNKSPAISAVPKPNFAEVGNMAGETQLQVQKASLLHLQSNTTLELSSNLDVLHIGKPNGQIPPDIDVAGFPDSEVVSRVHADIRVEGDAYYIEDLGSSNGTYINHAPLLQGNRHRLRAGDRIALGKGDLVTFIFQLN